MHDIKKELTTISSIGTDTRGEYPATFDMGELCIYDKALEDNERNSLWNYFEEKWKIE
ncbi:MAG: hypothetical protein GY830_01420 [Bacteroidetes bacterium]|nr:hypothetical protein [Bacteroidota bacterium]